MSLTYIKGDEQMATSGTQRNISGPKGSYEGNGSIWKAFTIDRATMELKELTAYGAVYAYTKDDAVERFYSAWGRMADDILWVFPVNDAPSGWQLTDH